MAKRPTVEVDEEYLKRVMAGDVPLHERKDPIIRDGPAKETQPDEIEAIDAVKDTIKESAKTSATRKKKDTQKYCDTFLKRRYPTTRKQAYIGAEIYEKITSFLPAIAKQLSISAFLDNILNHHIELYGEEIKELYNNNTKELKL